MIALSSIPTIYQNMTILVVVVVVKLMIGLFGNDNGMQYFHYYCQRLSDKVNKSSNSNEQQKIAGFIAVLLTLAPLVIILWLFEEFVAINWLWQLLLLYLAFGSLTPLLTSQKVRLALESNSKQSAKDLLQTQCLRDTQTLSPLGISKTTIEMQLLKHLQLHLGVACCFLFIGPITALAYRLIVEMHYSWNIKLSRFNHFGLASRLLMQLLLWLPIRIFYCAYLLTTLGNRFSLYFRLTRQYFFQLDSTIILTLHALKLNVQLGGVAMYHQKKLRRTAFNEQGNQPKIADIQRSSQQLIVVDIVMATIVCAAILITHL
ncbi:cobalamin biosynthesis protein [Thalassotalea piscium]